MRSNYIYSYCVFKKEITKLTSIEYHYDNLSFIPAMNLIWFILCKAESSNIGYFVAFSKNVVYNYDK